jgi:hypothetical protein
MKGARKKLIRFFWSWGFLKFVLWTVTLIVFFYIEEDWRGARAWAATKSEWEARGESFDDYKFIPPPIPDDQNLAAIPLFKMEPDSRAGGALEPLALQKALRQDAPGGTPGGNLPSGHLPSAGNWQQGQLPDMKKICDGIAVAYVEAFKNPPPSPDPLMQLDALFPFIADLHTASATRDYCSFPKIYRHDAPSYPFTPLMTEQIFVPRVLALHAVVALNDHRSDLALDDIRIASKLMSGLRRESLSVPSLCAIAVNATNEAGIYDGFATHAWGDAQLAEIQNEWASLDFLSDYQRMIRGELSEFSIPGYDHLKKDRTELKTEFREIHDYDPKRKIPDFLPDFWPSGWFDWMKAQTVTFRLNTLRFTDPKAGRVFPERVANVNADIARRQIRWDAQAPWSMLSQEEELPICSRRCDPMRKLKFGSTRPASPAPWNDTISRMAITRTH